MPTSTKGWIPTGVRCPEPRGGQRVRSKATSWRRGLDGLWRNTDDGRHAYTWATLTRCLELEVHVGGMR